MSNYTYWECEWLEYWSLCALYRYIVLSLGPVIQSAIPAVDEPLTPYSSACIPPKWCFNSFDIGPPLGEGMAGSVFLARTKSSPQFVLALKCVCKPQPIDDYSRKRILHEIAIHKDLRHPNILRFYGFFDDADKIYLMLEFAGRGDVYQLLVKHTCFSDRRSSKVSLVPVMILFVYAH